MNRIHSNQEDIPSKSKKRSEDGPSSRMPERSVFFEKVVPILLVVMGVVMVGLILFALGVLLGMITF